MKNVILTSFYLMSIVAVQAQETINLDEFDKLEVAGPFKVELIKSASPRLEIDYDRYRSSDVEIDERVGLLSIKLKPRSVFEVDGPYDSYMRVKVYYEDLDDIRSKMGAEIFSRDVIRASFLELSVNMGGEIRLTSESREVDVEVSAGGKVELDGRTEEGYFTTRMGGEIRARDLQCDYTHASTSMGGVIWVRANMEMTANCALGGEVYYYGDPEHVNTSANLGGTIIQRKDSN